MLWITERKTGIVRIFALVQTLIRRCRKAIDLALYLVIFRGVYVRAFAGYGTGIRWGALGLRCIPRSIRINNPHLIEIGNFCQFDEGVYLQTHPASEGIRIGDRVRLNSFVHVQAYSQIHIDDDVLIAPFVLVSSSDHGARSDDPIMNQEMRASGAIRIGRGSWIGRGASVLGGVTTSGNTVVAAGAVVTAQEVVDRGVVLAGVPARPINRRVR